jgi:hypothetical protein
MEALASPGVVHVVVDVAAAVGGGGGGRWYRILLAIAPFVVVI